jgi:uncharacterized Zn finger protein
MSHECPKCGPDHHLIEELIKNQQMNYNPDEFYKNVDDAKANPYAVLVEFMSKNLL